jgi:sigma-B regulation protein RsbU (phosphoserine phosphatase)
MRILIAEDERITRTSLARQLTSWGHEVTAAEDGEQAWERLAAVGGGTGGADYDIVITDWEMPRLSGLDLVRRIRAAPRGTYTYVILLTSRGDTSDIIRGIEAGADDYVAKPFDRDELRVRLLAGERIVRLERALSRQNAELRDANERIRSGLEAAARVQRSMLPQQNVVTPRVCTAWKYVPTDELAGDAIGLHLIDDRYLVAYVLDVSGHGVPAALLAVSAMHAMAPIPEATSLLRDMGGGDRTLGTVRHPDRVAAALNCSFRAGENDGRYLTMILCVLDTREGRLRLTSAGHPAPFVLRGRVAIAVPDAGGFPIAIVEGAEYDEGVVQLQPGDRVCLFSDGVLEQTAAGGDEQFGAARLLEVVSSRSEMPAERLASEVAEELSRWAGPGSFTDDVSIVVVEWRGDVGGGGG